jgi:signal peptidase II
VALPEFMKKNRWPRPLFFWVSLPILFFDQLTKYWAQTHLQTRGMIEVIPDLLNLTYVRNTGIAFGLFGGNNLLFLMLALGLLGGAFYYARIFDWQRREVNLVGALLLAGAVGNLIDRVAYGYVIDFIDVNLVIYRWPVFNIADSCITLSVLWIFYRTLFTKSIS